MYFSIKHREARGIGYDEGFSSVTGLVIPKVTDRFVPFIDGRLHVFNSGRFASNMGIGARYGLPWRDWVVGANAFWDHREIKHLRVAGLARLSSRTEATPGSARSRSASSEVRATLKPWVAWR